jgi:IMP cyclohydrolase
MQKIENLLNTNSYPGRGIIIGRSSDNEHAVIAYFIMGRSENSRNRVFVKDGDGIRTQAFDSAKLVDPSLIIYSPVKVLNDTTIVTNGDQTDTIYNYMSKGKTFADALRTRTFEPDKPNYTPRVSGIVDKKGNYKLSILKSNNGNPSSTQRFFFEYDRPLSGEGHFVHTYEGDGNPLPSFAGEPTLINIEGNIDEFSSTLWNSLNNDNKVSLFVRYINLDTGKTETKIINKNN